MGNRPGHLRLSQTRQSNHPLILGAALSILATALPSSAFAATTGYSTAVRLLNHYPFGTKPLLVRGGGGNRHQRGGSRGYSKAPPPEPKISPFTRPIKKVTIVGGTHGNEYTGVWCIKVIEKQRESYNNKRNNGDAGSNKNNNLNVFEEFTSFDIDTLLGNPVAHLENKRFVDVDLNREFSMEKLQRVPVDEETIEEECDIRNEFCSNGNVDATAETLASLPHEAVRAREIELLLGPKFNKDGNAPEEDHDADPNSCVVVDLHTTTANMGISLIIPEGDALMSAAAAYVMHKCKEKYGDDETQCLMHALPKRRDRMNLCK